MVHNPHEMLTHEIEELLRLSNLLKQSPEKEEIKNQIRYVSKKMDTLCKGLKVGLTNSSKELILEVDSFLQSPTGKCFESLKSKSLHLHNNLKEL